MESDLSKIHYFINRYKYKRSIFLKTVKSQELIQRIIYRKEYSRYNKNCKILDWKYHQKSQSIGFLGQGPIRCKTVVDKNPFKIYAEV
jgi:hypothetical protein